jgi:hypothetical protein
MNLCFMCERWYRGDGDRHWRYAHKGRTEESERKGW